MLVAVIVNSRGNCSTHIQATRREDEPSELRLMLKLH